MSLPLFDHYIFGNPNGRVVIFVAGWPDTYCVFRNNLMKALEKNYCIIGITLPGYEQPFTSRGTRSELEESKSKSSDNKQIVTTRAVRTPLFGYSMKDAIAMFSRTVEHVLQKTAKQFLNQQEEDAKKGSKEGKRTEASYRAPPKPIIVAHDWGAVFAQEFIATHHDLFERVVLLDVGGGNGSPDAFSSISLALYKVSFILMYQSFIMLTSYFLPSSWSSYLQLQFVQQGGARPQYTDDCSGAPVLPSYRMSWPYLRTYCNMISHSALLLSQRCVVTPHTPVLFLHAQPKTPMFFTEAFANAIRQRGEKDGASAVEEVHGGHWFFARPEARLDKYRNRIVDFIRAAK